MVRDALFPARNSKQSDGTRRWFQLVFVLMLLCLALLNACSVASSSPNPAANPQQQPSRGHFLTLSGGLAPATVGVSYNGTLTVSGGTAPYNFDLSWGRLPSGLVLDQNSGTISGKPVRTGTSNFGVHVTDDKGLGGAHSFQITVSDATTVVVSVTPATATVPSTGTKQFSALVSNTPNVAVTWSASAGTISSAGLYQAPKVTVTTNATVTATSQADTTKSGTSSVTLTAASTSPLSITTSSLSAAMAGTSYSSTVSASGGTSPYSWSVASGTLPTGFSLQSSGSLSGTTTQTGPFSFTVSVADSSAPQQTATKSFTLTVNAGLTGTTISKSFFGADFNGSKVWPPTDGQNLSANLGGIRLWDDGVKWGQINTASAVYDWTALDKWLDRAQTAGTDVLYSFGDTPQFAAASTPPGTCLSPGAYSCSPPTDVNKDGTGSDAYFQAFVTALVTHAAGRISFYELWNEPDYNGFWTGTQAQLVRMGKDAAAIIRALDPNAKILSPSAHGPTMATWFDGYVAAGGAPNFDIVNVHMRGQKGTNPTPEAFLTVWGQVQDELKARGLINLPVWDDEHGILKGEGLIDPDMLAGYVARSAILRASVGLQRQYVYTWDSPAPYGLQGNASGTAWNQVAGWLIGHTIGACTVSGTIYTCPIDNGQIVWDTAQTCSSGVCSTSNYTYPTTYVWHDDIIGARSALSGRTVPIGYKPILLENQ